MKKKPQQKNTTKPKIPTSIRDTSKQDRALFFYSTMKSMMFAGENETDIFRWLYNNLKNIEIFSTKAFLAQANAVALDILKDIASEKKIILPDNILFQALNPRIIKTKDNGTITKFLSFKELNKLTKSIKEQEQFLKTKPTPSSS